MSIRSVRRFVYNDYASPTIHEVQCDDCGYKWREEEAITWRGETENLLCPKCEEKEEYMSEGLKAYEVKAFPVLVLLPMLACLVAAVLIAVNCGQLGNKANTAEVEAVRSEVERALGSIPGKAICQCDTCGRLFAVDVPFGSTVSGLECNQCRDLRQRIAVRQEQAARLAEQRALFQRGVMAGSKAYTVLSAGGAKEVPFDKLIKTAAELDAEAQRKAAEKAAKEKEGATSE